MDPVQGKYGDWFDRICTFGPSPVRRCNSTTFYPPSHFNHTRRWFFFSRAGRINAAHELNLHLGTTSYISFAFHLMAASLDHVRPEDLFVTLELKLVNWYGGQYWSRRHEGAVESGLVSCRVYLDLKVRTRVTTPLFVIKVRFGMYHLRLPTH